MKYLSDYTREPQTKLFEDKGVIFAISKEQFDEQKQEDVQYVAGGAGMFCPKGELKNVLTALDRIQSEGIKQDLAEHGRDAIIKRELDNYECYYTGDISDVVAFLEQYGIAETEVWKVYNQKLR